MNTIAFTTIREEADLLKATNKPVVVTLNYIGPHPAVLVGGTNGHDTFIEWSGAAQIKVQTSRRFDLDFLGGAQHGGIVLHSDYTTIASCEPGDKRYTEFSGLLTQAGLDANSIQKKIPAPLFEELNLAQTFPEVALSQPYAPVSLADLVRLPEGQRLLCCSLSDPENLTVHRAYGGSNENVCAFFSANSDGVFAIWANKTGLSFSLRGIFMDKSQLHDRRLFTPTDPQYPDALQLLQKAGLEAAA